MDNPAAHNSPLGSSTADLTNCVVTPGDGASRIRARAVAEQLGLAFVADWRSATVPVALVVSSMGASLQLVEPKPPGPIVIDFAAPAMEYRRKGGQNELLGRAVGVKADRKPRVVDATAGLGRDAFVLADLGCEVTLIERSRVLAWLLAEAVAVAGISASGHVREAAARMQVVPGDSATHTVPAQAVIYLDPMFPERRSSAAVKKDLTLLQALHGNTDPGEEALWDWSQSQPAARIVVKRPVKAPPLCGQKPSHAISGKAVRFDVYVR